MLTVVVVTMMAHGRCVHDVHTAEAVDLSIGSLPETTVVILELEETLGGDFAVAAGLVLSIVISCHRQRLAQVRQTAPEAIRKQVISYQLHIVNVREIILQ